MKEMQLGPDEVIFNQNQVQQNIYIILKGNVLYQVWHKSKKQNIQEPLKTVKRTSKGSILGLLSFMSDQATSYLTRTEDVVQLVYVSRDEFLDTLKRHPADFELFHYMKSNL